MYYCVHTPSLSSFRHVTIRRRGSARAQQSTDSSAGARVSMSPTGWLSPSIPPPTPLDHLYLSVSQAALKSEVKRICLLKAVVRQLVQFSDVDIMNVGCCGYKNSFFLQPHLLFFSHRSVCVSGHAVPPPPADGLPCTQSLHLSARSVPLLSLSLCSRCAFTAGDFELLLTFRM